MSDEIKLGTWTREEQGSDKWDFKCECNCHKKNKESCVLCKSLHDN